MPCSSRAKQRASLRFPELWAYLGWMRCTHTPPRDKLTTARVMPQILKPYATLLFNVADFVRRRGHPSGRARALVTGTAAPSLPYAPKGSPTSAAACAPLPALPNPPSLQRALPLVFTVVRNLLKILFCL